jgi:hypothetical protein
VIHDTPLPPPGILQYKRSKLNVVYCNIPTNWMFCTVISLLTEYRVLSYPYWLSVLYCKIPTDWVFCTVISLLTECCVL